MSVYSNNVNLHLNEVVILEFREQNQNGIQIVSSVAMLYDVFKMLHDSMSEAIEQHEKKLHQLKAEKAAMN